MDIFNPEENTAICMYGPPEYFESLSDTEDTTAVFTEEKGFFEKIAELLKKLIDFIKGLFNKN